MKENTPTAIALISGGLDSTLAARMVKDEGVDVIGLHLLSPFGCASSVEASARNIGIPVLYKEKGESYLELVKNPKYGYGKNVNPCIDCRIFMFQLADSVREERGADFIITGEVLGQRPMSQRRDALHIIDRDSGLEDITLRPLSAHHFAPTLPERKGWVDRDHLLGISGRSRKEQLELAARLGITDYAAPGGGCLLTEASVAQRIRDFFSHEDPTHRLAQAELLRLGRHFRISNTAKVILGRNEKENESISLLSQKAGGTLFNPANFSGPTAIAFGTIGSNEREIVGSMIARYGKWDFANPCKVSYLSGGGQGDFIVDKEIDDVYLDSIRL